MSEKKRAARKPPKFGNQQEPKEEAELSPNVLRVLGIADAIASDIEDIPERAKSNAPDFFDSVAEKSASIADTIRRTGRVSDGQERALQGMLDGVRKWLHERD